MTADTIAPDRLTGGELGTRGGSGRRADERREQGGGRDFCHD
jgi:hypothetical protein